MRIFQKNAAQGFQVEPPSWLPASRSGRNKPKIEVVTLNIAGEDRGGPVELGRRGSLTGTWEFGEAVYDFRNAVDASKTLLIRRQVSQEVHKKGLLAWALGLISGALFFATPFLTMNRFSKLLYERYLWSIWQVDPTSISVSSYDLARGRINLGVGDVSLGASDPFLWLIIVGAVICGVLGLWGALTGNDITTKEAKTFDAAVALSGALILFGCGFELFQFFTGVHNYLLGGITLASPGWGSIVEAAVGLVLLAMIA